MAGDSVEAKKLGEEIWIAYRANSRHNFGDDSAATMGTAYSRLAGGSACDVRVIWDSSCRKKLYAPWD